MQLHEYPKIEFLEITANYVLVNCYDVLLLFLLCIHTVAELKAEAARIEMTTELECQKNVREAEIQFLREQNELEISKTKELGNIEVLDCYGSMLCSPIV